MSKYVIEFSKTGTICYTSHLDLMRIFKRVCKRTAVPLAYSQGFNPHPKMGFAQPLSLGYWGMEEYFECETAEDWTEQMLLQRLAGGMPEGIELKRCLRADDLKKTLASHTIAARYVIAVPVWEHGSTDGKAQEDAPQKLLEHTAGEAAVSMDPDADLRDPRGLWHSYMDLPAICAWKRQKKKKEPKQVDIKSMIREITFNWTPGAGSSTGSSGAEDHLEAGTLYIDTVLDCGSDSNLSPELVISTVLARFGIGTDRSEISVMRKSILFDQPLEELLRRA